MEKINVSYMQNNERNPNLLLNSFTNVKQDSLNHNHFHQTNTEIYSNPAFNILPINISNYVFSKSDKQYYPNNLDCLKCFYCLNIANNPLSCQNCQALICTKCIIEAKNNKSNFCCNKCNNIFIQKNLTFSLQNDLNMLKIKCPNNDCSQTLNYVEVKRHLEICLFTDRSLECHFCKTIVKTKNNNTREIYQHLNNCVLAMILCEFCNLYFLRNTLKEHKKNCQRQYSIANNINVAYSQYNIPISDQLLKNDKRLTNEPNSVNLISDINQKNYNNSDNNNLTCKLCNEKIQPTGIYSNQNKKHICNQKQIPVDPASHPQQDKRPAPAYEAQSFHVKNLQQNLSGFSGSNLVNSFNAKTFYGDQNNHYYQNLNANISNNQLLKQDPTNLSSIESININNNKNIIANPNNISNFIHNQNQSNTNQRNISFLNSNNNYKAPAYSNLNISNLNLTQNLSKIANEKYLLDSDRSYFCNNDYLTSIENFHKHNQSEIKNLLKNKDLEISQIKKDYESKINAIINNNIDQNQIAKKYLIYEDSPLTLNDLRVETEPNCNNRYNEGNNNKNYINETIDDKDLSIIEYSIFKNELEKLDEKNFVNVIKKNQEINEPLSKKSKEKNYNNKCVNEDIVNIFNEDLDIFGFDDNQVSLVNIINQNNLNNDELNMEGEDNNNRKMSSNNLKQSNLNFDLIHNKHNLEKEKMRKEFERENENIKQEYLMQLKDFTQNSNERNIHINLDASKIQILEEALIKIRDSILNKDEEISNLEILNNKYNLLKHEHSAQKERYEKKLEDLNKEIQDINLKNDQKISELKDEKQKEILKFIENNENTILKIKANYENLINLIRTQKDSDIKKLVSKHENDYQQLRLKHENSVENLKKEYKNQMEIIKKNYEINNANIIQNHEKKIKNYIAESYKKFELIQNELFVNIQKSFEILKNNINNITFKDPCQDLTNISIVNNININHFNDLIEQEVRKISLLKEKFNIKEILQEIFNTKSDISKPIESNNNKNFVNHQDSIQSTAKESSIRSSNQNNKISNESLTNTNLNNPLLKEKLIELERSLISEDNQKKETLKKPAHVIDQDTSKYLKKIENYEDNFNESKKNFEKILESLKDTITDKKNDTQNLIQDKREFENQPSKNKTNLINSSKEIKINKCNVSNGENLNTTENRNLENSSSKPFYEKLKILEKILSDYSNFMEKIIEDNKNKIDLLIIKSQLEINKINSSLFIDNGNSECDKKEKMKIIKEKIESEISCFKKLQEKKETELHNLKTEDKYSTNIDNTFFDYIDFFKKQKNSYLSLKEKYLNLKAENESEDNILNFSLIKNNNENFYHEFFEERNKILDTIIIKECEKLGNDRDLKEKISENIKDTLKEYLSKIETTFENQYLSINKNFEKEKKQLVNLNLEEIKKIKANYETKIIKVNDESNKKFKDFTEDHERRLQDLYLLNIQNKAKIEELEKLKNQLLVEKKELSESYIRKIDLLKSEHQFSIKNLHINKDIEIKKNTESLQKVIEQKHEEFENLIKQTETEKILIKNSFDKEIELLKIKKEEEIEMNKVLHIKNLEAIKNNYQSILIVKDNEMQEFKKNSEYDFNNLKSVYDRNINDINTENQIRIDVLVKKFELEIIKINTDFSNQFKNMENIISEKTAENNHNKIAIEQAYSDIKILDLKLKELEAQKNAEIINLKNQNEIDIQNMIDSYKQKIESIEIKHLTEVEKLKEVFEDEKSHLKNFYENKINDFENERRSENGFLLSKYENDFLSYKQQYENEFDKITIDQKNEIKEVLEKSFKDISTLKQTYEMKIKNIEILFLQKIEILNSENKELRINYEKNIELFNLEKMQILEKFNSCIDDNKINKNIDNKLNVNVHEVLQNIKQDLIKFNLINLTPRSNNIEFNENSKDLNNAYINELENSLKIKNEEINNLTNELNSQKEFQQLNLRNELEKLNSFYLEEIKQIKSESKKHEEFVINNKNQEIQDHSRAFEIHLNEEKNKLISEFEAKTRLITENHNYEINNMKNVLMKSNNHYISPENDLILFKELLVKEIKHHYEKESILLKEKHGKELNVIRNEKFQAIEILKKENELKISLLKEKHQKEIDTILEIKTQNSDIKDENDFKERILIDYLKEKFTLNCDISDIPSIIPLAYNIVKGLEKQKHKTKLIGIRKNKFIPGYGISFYENGEIYEGEFQDNIPHGFGIIYQIRLQKIYEGFFEEGEKNGKGSYNISETQFYEGDFKNNNFHGKGTLINNGAYYNGDWVNNEKNGFGNIVYNNGERFEGFFKNNLRNGKGFLYKLNGEVFDGHWINDIRKGNGVLIYPNGCKLVGFWDDELNNFEGKFHGNPLDMSEFNICKIVKEKLVEKSDKFYEKEKKKLLKDNEVILEVNYKEINYEIIVTKLM